MAGRQAECFPNDARRRRRGTGEVPLRRLLAAALSLAALGLARPAGGQQPAASPAERRVRARELGVAPGIFPTGPANAITDVAGVRVGHATLRAGDSVRTGVTAILPHGGDLFRERVPAALHAGNGFGKLLGVTQLAELGELETPILLTCTLCVWRAADALVGWMLERPGMADVRSINPVVGETNDGALSAIRSRPVGPAEVRAALERARGGPVEEGSVGAGTGTVAFGWKGGIGTASRVVPASLGGWTVGVLVQSNFGGVLQVMGAPVGRELGKWAFRDAVEGARGPRPGAAAERGDGSIMIVVATDAPLSDRNLRRLAARTMMGLARTGSSASNGSGDYALAFSTAAGVRRRPFAARGAAAADSSGIPSLADLANEETSALFQAVVEATEEAIYNSLFMATTTSGNGMTVEAIPLARVREVLRKYGVSGR
jgi:D-aminopeptidase